MELATMTPGPWRHAPDPTSLLVDIGILEPADDRFDIGPYAEGLWKAIDDALHEVVNDGGPPPGLPPLRPGAFTERLDPWSGPVFDHPEASELAKRRLESYERLAREWLAVPAQTDGRNAATRALVAKLPTGEAWELARAELTAEDPVRVGLSPELLPGMLAIHGDDQGLVVPPRIAPVQVAVIAPTAGAPTAAGEIQRVAEQIVTRLGRKDVRSALHQQGDAADLAAQESLRGTPMCVEVDPALVDQGRVRIRSRDGFIDDTWAVMGLRARIEDSLDALQRRLLKRAAA